MNKPTNISLELLILNDLLNTKVIDNNLYSLALSKLRETQQQELNIPEKITVPVTA